MLLLGVHGQLAALTRSPELAIDPVQAKHLADAAAKVAAFYPGVGLDPKTAAWFNLAQVALVIYGPKVFNIRARKREERASAIRTREAQARSDEMGGSFDPAEAMSGIN